MPDGVDKMSIVAWIVVGLLAGWFATNIAERHYDLLPSIVIGAAGGLIGGFLFSSLLAYRYAEELHVRSVLLAAVSAFVLIAIFRILYKRDTDEP